VPRPTASAQPASIPARLEIVAESAGWIVINKPPLLQVHPSKPSHEATLWHLLRHLLAFELANGGQVSIVNRLDRETSGLVLIAKTHDDARHFCMLMERGRIAKQYLALVCGWPAEDHFTIDAPLLRQGAQQPSRIYLKQCVHPAGATARTRFQVLQRFTRNGPFALVRVFPETGRMHQIRVHLAHAGHPVVGDKIYGPSEDHYLTFIETGWTPALEQALLLRRHALHSALLEIPCDALQWETPLPPDMAAFLTTHEPSGSRLLSSLATARGGS
jgi:23S rRNA pseudouridine1911/1915/1917 synthase